ncbi:MULTISPECIES: integrase catalytic domain-containing protein [Burkholderia]|uniref:integrase catalytic domain-containing protein n=1 Tax=Burkholderia TaxID=32008 RepID=UPI0023DDB6FD|nr:MULTISPECIES: transposase family protein [Burkholderia cepacia complex]MDF3095276.1 transposase family protein [Burkholderia semiarida]MDF3104208.1 transposase family protein [Burkholderia semiarida]MDN7479975.1 transposase family protein [Burkholderia orbicola]
MLRFDPAMLYSLFDRLDTPPATRQQILDAFRQPARWTAPTPHAAPSRLPCPKMGMHVNVANAIERRAALNYMFDDQVFGYLDAAIPLCVQYVGRNGRTVRYNHTPSFLVMTDEGLYLDDWMPCSRVEKLVTQGGSRIVAGDDQPRSPPFEKAALSFGLTYRLRTDHDLSERVSRNQDFFRTYLLDSMCPNPGFDRDIAEFLRLNGYATLEELFDAIPHRTKDEFYSALANRRMISDWSSAFVKDSNRFMVFRDTITLEVYRCSSTRVSSERLPPWRRDLLSIGTKISLAGTAYTVAASGDLDVLLQSDEIREPLILRQSFVERAYASGTLVLIDDVDGSPQLTLDSPWRYATTGAVLHAQKMRDLLAAWEAGVRSEAVRQYTDRTYREYAQKKRKALANGTDVLAAFLPRWAARGNRRVKVKPGVDALIAKTIEEKYETLTGKSKWFVYAELCDRLAQIGETVSKQTFLKRIKREDGARLARKRRGRKAAYQVTPLYWTMNRETPLHGDYPMQFVHIDHTPLEIDVISMETGESLGRPYLTLLICSYSRRILGFYLSLLSPRYLSCMAAILDMVRRFGRVPSTLIFDGGAEFGSKDFIGLLDFLRIEAKSRPASACRHGTVIERHFGITQSMLLHNLPGNTKMRRCVRELTQETDPARLANLTLPDLYEGLEKFFFEIYDTRRHGTLLASPRSIYESGIQVTGERLNRLKRYEDCIPHAFPTVRGTTRVLDAQRGLKLNYDWYRNPRLELTRYHQRRVEVKMHLLRPEIAYAHVDGEWIPMYSTRWQLDEQATDFVSQARAEERLVLCRRTQVSHLKSMVETTRLAGEMIESSGHRTAVETVPETAAALPAASSTCAKTPNVSMESTFEKLETGGARGYRYTFEGPH